MKATAMLQTLQDVEAVEDLIRINADGAKGYRSAAKWVKDSELKGLFEDMAGERESCAEALMAMVNACRDENIALDPEPVGRLHRWWIEAEGFIEHDDRSALLLEMERSEDRVRAYYESVLQDLGEAPAGRTVREQLDRIRQRRERVRDLR